MIQSLIAHDIINLGLLNGSTQHQNSKSTTKHICISKEYKITILSHRLNRSCLSNTSHQFMSFFFYTHPWYWQTIVTVISSKLIICFHVYLRLKFDWYGIYAIADRQWSPVCTFHNCHDLQLSILGAIKRHTVTLPIPHTTL